jgi:hypothetical protein
MELAIAVFDEEGAQFGEILARSGYSALQIGGM